MPYGYQEKKICGYLQKVLLREVYYISILFVAFPVVSTHQPQAIRQKQFVGTKRAIGRTLKRKFKYADFGTSIHHSSHTEVDVRFASLDKLLYT